MWGIVHSNAGVTRDTFLIGELAFKLPKLTGGWKCFLQGLLANMQERAFAGYSNKLCPVYYANQFGLLVIMQRAEIITQTDFENIMLTCTPADKQHFSDKEGLRLLYRDTSRFMMKDSQGNILPGEFKRDSFGRINGELVLVDFGN